MSLSLLATPTLALATRAPVIRMQAEVAVETPPPPLPLIKVRLARRARLPPTRRARRTWRKTWTCACMN